MLLRPTLDGGPGFKFLVTNLDSFEANPILRLHPPLMGPSLHLGSPNYELSFELFFVWGGGGRDLKSIDFLFKIVPC
jgi:hypothetical protein